MWNGRNRRKFQTENLCAYLRIRIKSKEITFVFRTHVLCDKNALQLKEEKNHAYRKTLFHTEDFSKIFKW